MAQIDQDGAEAARPPRPLQKYVFIQDEPFYLPKVLDKYLREFAGSTAGVNIQQITQGKRTLVETARDLFKLYGPRYFLWKSSRFAFAKVVDRLPGGQKKPRSVAAVAAKYGVPVTRGENVNSDGFRAHLRDKGVELIVSISGTQFYGKALRDQTPAGIVNCHGALLPEYRGLMPSFWTLVNGERRGGVTVHFVDEKLDNGPIVAQRDYRIWPHDSLEEVMARSKDLAAEVIIEAVRKIEAGDPELMENDAEAATHFSMPTAEHGRAFRASGRRFV